MRVHHIALRTRRHGEVVRFYGEVLGLPVVRDATPRSTWFGLEGGAVLMVETATPEEGMIDPSTLELLCFGMERGAMERWRQHLSAARVTIEDETDHTLYFRDPDGRRVGLSDHPLT